MASRYPAQVDSLMNKSQDAFGQLLLSCLHGNESLEIIERDDGFIEAGYGNRYFTSYEEWPSHHVTAMRYARGRILDIGCGAGTHSVYCQEQGCRVLGIDISPGAIQVSRHRGLRDGKVMAVTQVSASLGVFDTILMLGGNFGTLGNSKRASRLLNRLHRMTTPTACIIAESRDPYLTTESDHRKYHKENRSRGRMSGQVRIRVRFKNLKTPWFDYLFVSKEEMEQVLNDTGWHVTEFLDSGGASYIGVLSKS